MIIEQRLNPVEVLPGENELVQSSVVSDGLRGGSEDDEVETDETSNSLKVSSTEKLHHGEDKDEVSKEAIKQAKMQVRRDRMKARKLSREVANGAAADAERAEGMGIANVTKDSEYNRGFELQKALWYAKMELDIKQLEVHGGNFEALAYIARETEFLSSKLMGFKSRGARAM